MTLSAASRNISPSLCCAILMIFLLLIYTSQSESQQPALSEPTFNDLRYRLRKWKESVTLSEPLIPNEGFKNETGAHIHYSPKLLNTRLPRFRRIAIHHHVSLQPEEIAEIRKIFPNAQLVTYTDHRFWFMFDITTRDPAIKFAYYMEDFTPSEEAILLLIDKAKAQDESSQAVQEYIFGLHGVRNEANSYDAQKPSVVDTLLHGWLLPDHLLDLFLFTARTQMRSAGAIDNQTEADVSLSTVMITRTLQHLGIKSMVLPSNESPSSMSLSQVASSLILPDLTVEVAVLIRSPADTELCDRLDNWHCHITQNEEESTITGVSRSESSLAHFLAFVSPQVVIHADDHSLHLPSTIVEIKVNMAQIQSYIFLNTLSVEVMRNYHKPRITLTVITATRLDSLSRLLTSLQRSHYLGDIITLSVSVDASASNELLHYLHRFQWPFGPYTLRHRIESHGLLPAISESWYPVTLHDYSIILEDDIEVSPYFYSYSKQQTLLLRYPTPQANIFGISLYTPRVSEITYPKRQFVPTNYTTTPFLLQLPCSWGAVYFPEYWWTFHQYVQSPSVIRLPSLKSNGWKLSWKKYFMELVYVYGWLMLYPNHPSGSSFSTNHMEVGEHFGRTYQGSKKDYTVPLITEWDHAIFESFGGFVFDVYHDPSSMEEIIQRGITGRGAKWTFESRWI